MILFNSDLDNTLIYSYKHDIGKEKRCVEIYKGKEISFMTEKSYNLLLKISKNVVFVPITTRTVEQYKRIKFKNIVPYYALVCNGGVLLIDGFEDNDWYKESLDFAKESVAEFEKAVDYLSSDININFEIRNIKKLFIFTKSSQPFETIKNLKKQLNMKKVDVLSIGEKIYILPKKLNKGIAMERIKKKLNISKVVVAGDSKFDIPMLDKADIAIAPCGLGVNTEFQSKVKFFNNSRIFSDDLLEYIENM